MLAFRIPGRDQDTSYVQKKIVSVRTMSAYSLITSIVPITVGDIY